MRRAVQVAVSLGGVAALTWAARVAIPVNASTAGFGYLLLVLVIAGAWGFVEALAASLAATLTFNYFFFPPIGAFTIHDPQNWVALFSFLATSIIASRLSAIAKQRALDAVAKQEDLERLYALSRDILLIGNAPPFAAQFVEKLAGIFELDGVALYDADAGEIYRHGVGGVRASTDEALREAAAAAAVRADPNGRWRVTPIHAESKVLGSLALEGRRMPDSVERGIANLTAIGLQRAKAQDLELQIEAARRSEQLRTTLIDAMAHEFKTPLTSIKAATTSLLAEPAQCESARLELLRIADEEASRLSALIDDSVDLARLETARFDISAETSDVVQTVREAIDSLGAECAGRIELITDSVLPLARFDRNLIRLALKQLLDNAMKYSLPESPVRVRIGRGRDAIKLDITNRGPAIPSSEQRRIFERFYRSREVRDKVPGSGLGLSIAQRIAQAHEGDVSVASREGETTFRLTLPVRTEEERAWAQGGF